MSNEHQPNFEKDLAAAAESGEFEGEQVEPINDPARSLENGLITLYDEYLFRIDRQRQAGLINQAKADELANNVLDLVEKDGLRNEIGFTPTEKAREIMGPGMFFGPDEVVKAGIEIREKISPIPFNPEELERAKELGQMLIYRTSTTLEELNNSIILKIKARTLGFIPQADPHWYDDDGFYWNSKIQPGWALVSKELNPGSTDKNYLEQSEFLAEYLVNLVYQGKPLPRIYLAAIDQLNAQKETIQLQMDLDNECSDSIDDIQFRKAGQMLANLEINQLTRQSAAEAVYDCLVHFLNTHRLLHENDYLRTSTISRHGELVDIKAYGSEEDELCEFQASAHFTDTGTSFSRRGANLKS